MWRKYRSGLAMASMLVVLMALGGHEISSVAALSPVLDPTTISGADPEATSSPTAATPEATSTPQATPVPTIEPPALPTPDVTPTPVATPTPVGAPLLVDVYAEVEFPCEADGFCPNDPRVGYGLALTGEFDAALVDRTEPFDGMSALWGLVLPGTASGSIGGSFDAVLTAGPGEVYPVIDVTCFENRLRPDRDIMERIPTTLEGQSASFRLDVDPTDEFVYVVCDFSLNFAVVASPVPSVAAPSVPPTLPPTDLAVEGQEPTGGDSLPPLHVLAGLVTAALVATWPTRRGRGTHAAGQHRR
jgi:hypothetical protein